MKIKPLKHFIFLSFLFFILPFYIGQNERDDNGKKHGKWVYTGKDRPLSGYATTAKIEEGSYEHGRKTGVWMKYQKDGKTIKLKGVYVNNRPKGDYARFYANGTLKEKGSFGEEKFSGELIRYHKNGKVAYTANFNNEGKESGTVKHYYSNGKLQAEYVIKSGKTEGLITQYNEDGTIKSSYNASAGKITNTVKPVAKKENTTYSDPPNSDPPPKVTNPITKGVRFFPEGYNKVYNLNDEIWLDGNFKSGQLWDGKVYIYNDNGILKKVKVFKEGKFHSFGQL